MPKKRYEAPAVTKLAPEKQLFVRKIQAKNYTQELYMQHLRDDPIIFGQGPAGSGKTFIATAIACEKLIANEVSKIVLTRPIVEAGEKLGFLPGTLEEKVHPYLLPLLDGLNSHLGPKKVQDLMMEGKIEVAPLAYMRGRTFDNCLTKDHTVLLSNGTQIRIDKLVSRFEAGESFEVKSFNHVTNEIEDSVISFAFKQERDENLLMFTLEDGTELKMTKDHKMFVVGKGYIEAQYITDQDELMILEM